jgi:uncharacterized protein (TIGR02569 family)
MCFVIKDRGSGWVPGSVLASFGITSRIGEALPGGQGRSARYGDVVLKPVEDPVEAGWACHVLANIEERGFRSPRPVRANDGRWVVDGWAASTYLPGEPGPTGKWQQLLDAGRAFHRELAALGQPTFLANRSHRWAHADRVAWGEASADPSPEVASLLVRLQRMTQPVSGSPQLIHGDLAGNVLFHDAHPPAIIDFSPYWRPVEYADAIVAVDGLLWFEADHALLSAASSGAQFGRYLVRAAIFRLIALDARARIADDSGLEELAIFQRVIADVEALQ